MILYVCKYSNLMASARYRGYGWGDRLRQQGYIVKIIYAQKDAFVPESYFSKLLFLFKLLISAMTAQVIIFQKYIPPISIQQLLRGKRIIFDFDDRIYDQPLLNSKSRINALLQLASQVIVSVPSIQNELIECLPELSSKVSVIPTLIDISKFAIIKPLIKAKSKLIIAWIGSSPGLPYLNLIEGAISNLIAEFDDLLEFVVISNQPYTPTQADLPVKNIQWSLTDELKYFADIDILVMPLDESDRAKSKAGFKVIQALAAGLPVVASAIGFNQEIIHHGKNGFLAKTPHDFYTYLKCLMVSHRLRQKMAESARESAKAYDYSVWEADYIQQVLSSSKDR